jgi:hypothetical protein
MDTSLRDGGVEPSSLLLLIRRPSVVQVVILATMRCPRQPVATRMVLDRKRIPRRAVR